MANGEVSAIKATKEAAASAASNQAGNSRVVESVAKTMAKSSENKVQINDFKRHA